MATNPQDKEKKLYPQLNALLHTVRCIAQHEDQLCTLLHESRKTRSISARSAREIRALLDKMPSREYLADFEALYDSLPSES